jgi:single-stranded DNA-binding protein
MPARRCPDHPQLLARACKAGSLACAQPLFVSTATLIVALAAHPTGTQAGGKEVLEAFASTVNPDPLSVLLRCPAGSNAAKAFAAKAPGDRLIASGDLILDEAGNLPILYPRVLCDASAEQYLNEVTLVGRIAGEARTTESAKSCSRSLAVNRYVASEELTDWYKVRGFGYAKDKLEAAPKGALVAISGALEQRTNRDGQPYCEIKCRSLRIHGRPKGATHNPAAGTSATGYSHEDFSGPDEMPFNWS